MAARPYEYFTTLPKEHYAHIGEIVYRLSLLDFQLVQILGLILGLNKKQARLAYVNSDFKGKLAVLKVLSSKWVRDSGIRSVINDLIGYAFKLEERRNTYAHCVLGRETGTHDVNIVHMRTGEQRHLPQAEKWDPEFAREERAMYDMANKLAGRLIGMLECHGNDPKFVTLELRQPDPGSPN